MTREEKRIIRHKFFLGLKAWRESIRMTPNPIVDAVRYKLFDFMTQRVRMGIISKDQFARLVSGVIKWR